MKTNIKEKVIILLIAALFAFIGFNLLVSPTAVDLIKMNNSADYEITYVSQITYITQLKISRINPGIRFFHSLTSSALSARVPKPQMLFHNSPVSAYSHIHLVHEFAVFPLTAYVQLSPFLEVSMAGIYRKVLLSFLLIFSSDEILDD